jgi:hypothetical protein
MAISLPCVLGQQILPRMAVLDALTWSWGQRNEEP